MIFNLLLLCSVVVPAKKTLTIKSVKPEILVYLRMSKNVPFFWGSRVYVSSEKEVAFY